MQTITNKANSTFHNKTISIKKSFYFILLHKHHNHLHFTQTHAFNTNSTNICIPHKHSTQPYAFHTNTADNHLPFTQTQQIVFHFTLLHNHFTQVRIQANHFTQ